MKRDHITIEAEGKEHRLEFTRRDLDLLWGPFFKDGPLFIRNLGVYERFTVAGGIPKGSKVTRNPFGLLTVTKQLLSSIRRDEDLLSYDYQYSFSKEGKRKGSGGRSGFRVRGLIGSVSVRPHGYCYLELSQVGCNGKGRVVEFIDMRVKGSIETDDLGVLKAHRRKADVLWLATLPKLVKFLDQLQAKEVTIHHTE